MSVEQNCSLQLNQGGNMLLAPERICVIPDVVGQETDPTDTAWAVSQNGRYVAVAYRAEQVNKKFCKHAMRIFDLKSGALIAQTQISCLTIPKLKWAIDCKTVFYADENGQRGMVELNTWWIPKMFQNSNECKDTSLPKFKENDFQMAFDLNAYGEICCSTWNKTWIIPGPYSLTGMQYEKILDDPKEYPYKFNVFEFSPDGNVCLGGSRVQWVGRHGWRWNPNWIFGLEGKFNKIFWRPNGTFIAEIGEWPRIPYFLTQNSTLFSDSLEQKCKTCVLLNNAPCEYLETCLKEFVMINVAGKNAYHFNNLQFVTNDLMLIGGYTDWSDKSHAKTQELRLIGRFPNFDTLLTIPGFGFMTATPDTKYDGGFDIKEYLIDKFTVTKDGRFLIVLGSNDSRQSVDEQVRSLSIFEFKPPLR